MEKILESEFYLNLKYTYALVFGNAPSIEKAQALSEGYAPVDVQSLGLFGDSPNYNTFYPNADEKAWTPEDEDFVYPTFRLLSETMVVKYGVPIDFSKTGVLKSAMKLFKGITLNPDHEAGSVGNALGVVADVYWQESYKLDGITIPAGVNGVLKIDAKSNPRIARGVTMKPPSIHSGSSTVKIKTERSHPELTEQEFFEKAGSYDSKGDLYRLIVVGIQDAREYSLVSRGADPFSQQVNKDGKIADPHRAKKTYNLSDDNFSYRDMLNTTVSFIEDQNAQVGDNHINNNINNNDQNMELTLAQLLEKLGLSAEGLGTEEAIVQYFKESLQASTSLKALLDLKADLTPASLQDLMAVEPISPEQTATLTALAELGGLELATSSITAVANNRKQIADRAIADYRLVAGDAASDIIVASISSASLEAAEAFAKEYGSQVERLLPLTCQECNSHNVSRAATKEVTPKNQQKSFDEIRNQAYEIRSRKPNAMHTTKETAK